MRVKALLLIWGGLVLSWLSVGVLPWAWDTADGATLADVAASLPPDAAASVGDPQYYVAYGFVLPLAAVTLLSVLLPARARGLRILAGVLYLVLAALVAAQAFGVLEDRLAGPPGELGRLPALLTEAGGRWMLVGAAVLAAVGLLFLLGQVWLVGWPAGLLALGGALWHTHVVVTQVQENAVAPGPGALGVALGYLLVAAGCFAVATDRSRARRSRARRR